MSTSLVTDLTIFILALLVGIEVIGKVPATLHTPLMSAANSIHGIVLAGALLIGVTAHSAVGYILAFVACFFAAANVVGGYAVTGRMLKMFRRRAVPVPAANGSAGGAVAGGAAGAVGGAAGAVGGAAGAVGGTAGAVGGTANDVATGPANGSAAPAPRQGGTP